MTINAKKWRVRVLACLLVSGAICTQLTFVPSAFAAEPAIKEDKGFAEKMREWQDKMSETFRDAWKDLRKGKGESDSTASLDLREQKDGYTVRLNLPDRDLAKVEVKLEDGSLRIAAPAEGKIGKYEQTMELDGVAANAEPMVERKQKDATLVITIPKTASTANAKPAFPDGPRPLLEDWDREIMARMEKMRRDMDRVFDEAFAEFKLAPEFKGFFDEPRFGSSVDLKDEGDHYTVRAYLPERSMEDVKVTLEGQTLRIEAKEQEAEEKKDEPNSLRRERKAAYSQILTLPGPVKSEKMKVDKKQGMLVVTLPKGS